MAKLLIDYHLRHLREMEEMRINVDAMQQQLYSRTTTPPQGVNGGGYRYDRAGYEGGYSGGRGGAPFRGRGRAGSFRGGFRQNRGGSGDQDDRRRLTDEEKMGDKEESADREMRRSTPMRGGRGGSSRRGGGRGHPAAAVNGSS
ncbi:hypothetical protein AB6A40_009285 [Gnathostoma spinigerum]|uniref:Uncharacterized protein n=1 Tax=Gnathostoma spinigerum TaxID=75299 RepID=A0ABD6ETE7_9BILA